MLAEALSLFTLAPHPTPSPPQVQRFPELEAAIAEAIATLGGRVVPKLTWSAPVDATWVNPGGTLACTHPQEVLLLLKSSDRVAHDICHALAPLSAATSAAAAGGAAAQSGPAPGGGMAGGFAAALGSQLYGQQPQVPAEGQQPFPLQDQQQQQQEQQQQRRQQQEQYQPSLQQVQHTLALRKWYNLRPEREFRCFVRRGSLVGACQREVTQRYEALTAEVEQLEGQLLCFHEQHIAG